MDYLNLWFHGNGVLAENGPIKHMTRQRASHSYFERVKGVSYAAGDFPPAIDERPESSHNL
jgi:hypothetical protein